MRIVLAGLNLSAVLILALLQIPKVAEFINCLPSYILWIVYTLVLIATIINFFSPVYAPGLKVMEMSEANENKLNKAVSDLNKAYRKSGIQFNVNIMLTKTLFFQYVEPKDDDSSKAKLSLIMKGFDVIWSHPDGVNDQLTISINQGVCGAAYREGTATSYTQIKAAVFGEHGGNENFNFTDKQLELTRSLKMVASCPLVIVTRGKKSQVRTKIGVLNVESRSHGAETLINDPAQQKNFYQQIANLAVLYTNLCS